MDRKLRVLCFLLLTFFVVTYARPKNVQLNNDNSKVHSISTAANSDLDTSATSARLFNLGSVFGRNPYYYSPSYSNAYNPNTYRPGVYSSQGTYYPYNKYPLLTNGVNGYYPHQTNSYYPSGTGTNILGSNGGYGGYGGNGGLRQYFGYWDPDYNGHRNLGYGYHVSTDRYGFPRRGSFDYDRTRNKYGSHGRDRIYGINRGFD